MSNQTKVMLQLSEKIDELLPDAFAAQQVVKSRLDFLNRAAQMVALFNGSLEVESITVGIRMGGSSSQVLCPLSSSMELQAFRDFVQALAEEYSTQAALLYAAENKHP